MLHSPDELSTSIWLLDARDLVGPSARLEGFDISLDGVPPADALPENVKFRHLDVKSDVPDDLVGAFDIIHLRFLSFVLLNDQIPTAVERLFKMLSWSPSHNFIHMTMNIACSCKPLLSGEISEPGGYIQWGEFDFETVHTEKTRPENKTEALIELHDLFSIQDPRLRPTWITKLPVTLSAAGFDQVEAAKSEPPPHRAFILHECGLMMYEVFCRKTKNDKIREQLRRILPLAVEETRIGAYTTAVYWTVIARRPVSES